VTRIDALTQAVAGWRRTAVVVLLIGIIIAACDRRPPADKARQPPITEVGGVKASTTQATASPAESKSHSPTPTVSQPTVRPLAEGVVLNVKVDILQDGRVQLSGVSNLPDMTEIMASVGNRRLGFMAQGRGNVLGSTLNIEPLGPVGGLASGVYKAEVTTPYPRYQPESVQAVIGADGHNLRGPLVSRDAFGRTVTVKQTFKVGSASAVDEAKLAEESSARARQLYTQIEALLRQSRGLSSLRNRPSEDLNASRACGDRMRILQPQAEHLADATSQLPRQYSFSLGSAAAALRMCVSCSAAADGACRQVAEILIEAKAEMK
jgi:hypothetical protein